MMKNRLVVGLGGSVDLGRNRVVIRLPDPKLLLLIAKTAFIALAILSFPWLHVAIRRATAVRSGSDQLESIFPIRPAGSTGRRLLSIPDAKKEALNGLEDVVLEPPARGRKHRRWKTNYLPDLMGDSLDSYPRRVFVDVGQAGRAGSEGWFKKRYPKRNREFEIIRVDVVGQAAEAAGGMTEWLRRNVREEEYVVMKAEAEVVDEMVKGGAIGLVDEMFLECRNQWQIGKRGGGGVGSRRAYWECLALYGRLKDEGVAVHQWWG